LRIVRTGVVAPDPVIEDACQFAWSRLLHHRERVHRETALAWLVTTAQHEAAKLLRRAGRDVSLEMALERGLDVRPWPGDRSPHLVAEEHERLRSLASLPARQQRLLWLYGVGLSYEEIARSQGCTSRTVERQLNRARTTLQLRDAVAR
jgi:RNA polymerase sigma factor (sigma-70 family)